MTTIEHPLKQSNTYLSYLLTSSLCVPISERAEKFQPLSFAISEQNLWLAFSSALKMSEFFEKPQEFTEIAPRALIRMAKDADCGLGFDLGQDYGVILDQAALNALDDILKDQETVENISEFDFQECDLSAFDIEKINAILPDNTNGWLAMEREQGLILIINSDDFALSAKEIGSLREKLLNFPQSEKISLLFLDKNHPNGQKIAKEIEKFGQPIKSLPKIKTQNPPILR